MYHREVETYVIHWLSAERSGYFHGQLEWHMSINQAIGDDPLPKIFTILGAHENVIVEDPRALKRRRGDGEIVRRFQYKGCTAKGDKVKLDVTFLP